MHNFGPCSFGFAAVLFWLLLLCGVLLGMSAVSEAQAQAEPFHNFNIEIGASRTQFTQQSAAVSTFATDINVFILPSTDIPITGFRLRPVGEPQGLILSGSDILSFDFVVIALFFSVNPYNFTLQTEGVDGRVELRVLAPAHIPEAAVAHESLHILVRALPVLTAVEFFLQPQPGLSTGTLGVVSRTTTERASVVMGFRPVYSSGSAAPPSPVNLDLSVAQLFGTDTTWHLSATRLSLRPNRVTTVTLSVEPVFDEELGLLLSAVPGSGRGHLLSERLFRFSRIPLHQLQLWVPSGIQPSPGSSRYTLTSVTVTATDHLGTALEPTGINLSLVATGRIMPLQQNYALEFIDGVARLPDIELNLAALQSEQIEAVDILARSATRSYTVAIVESGLEYILQGIPEGFEYRAPPPTVLARAELLGLNGTVGGGVPSELFANQRVYIVEPEHSGVETTLLIELDSISVGADAPLPLQLCLNIEFISLAPENLPLSILPEIPEDRQGRRLGSIRPPGGGDNPCEQHQLSLLATAEEPLQVIRGVNAVGDEVVVARNDSYRGLQLRIAANRLLQSALVRVELQEPRSGIETAFEILIDPGALLTSAEIGLDPAVAVEEAAIIQRLPTGTAIDLPLLFTAVGSDALPYNSSERDLPLTARIYALENIAFTSTNTADFALDSSAQRYFRKPVNFIFGKSRLMIPVLLQQQGRNGRIRIELDGSDQHGGAVPAPLTVEVRAVPVISRLQLEVPPFYTSVTGRELSVPLTLRLSYVDVVAQTAVGQLYIVGHPPLERVTVLPPAGSPLRFAGELSGTATFALGTSLQVILNSARNASFEILAEAELNGYRLSTSATVSIVYVPPLGRLLIISSSTVTQSSAAAATLTVTVRAVDVRGGLFDLNDLLTLHLLGIDNIASFDRQLQFVAGIARAELNLELLRRGRDALFELDLSGQDSTVAVARQRVAIVAVPVLEHIEVSIVGLRRRTLSAGLHDRVEVLVRAYASDGEPSAVPNLELLALSDEVALFQGVSTVTTVALSLDASGQSTVSFNTVLADGYRSAVAEFDIRTPLPVRVSSTRLYYSTEAVLAAVTVDAPTELLQSLSGEALEVTLTVTARGSDGMDWPAALPGLRLNLLGVEPPLIAAVDISGFDGLLDFGGTAPFAARQAIALSVPEAEGVRVHIGVVGALLDETILIEPAVLNLRGPNRLTSLSLVLPARLQQRYNNEVSTFVISIEARDDSGAPAVPLGLRLMAEHSNLQVLQFDDLLRFDSSGNALVVVAFLPERAADAEARFNITGIDGEVQFSASNNGRIQLLPTPEFDVDLYAPRGTQIRYYNSHREVEVILRLTARQRTEVALNAAALLTLVPQQNNYFRELSLSGNQVTLAPQMRAHNAVGDTIRLRLEMLPGVLATTLSFSFAGPLPSTYHLNLEGDTELALVLFAEQQLHLELAAGITTPTARADSEAVTVPLRVGLTYRGEGVREPPRGLQVNAELALPGTAAVATLRFAADSTSSAVTAMVVPNSSRTATVRFSLSGGNVGTSLPPPLLLEIPFIPLPARFRLVDNGAAFTLLQQGPPDQRRYLPPGPNAHLNYQWELLGSDGRPYTGALGEGLVRPELLSGLQIMLVSDVAAYRSFRYNSEMHGHLQFYDLPFELNQNTANYHCNAEHLQYVELYDDSAEGGIMAIPIQSSATGGSGNPTRVSLHDDVADALIAAVANQGPGLLDMGMTTALGRYIGLDQVVMVLLTGGTRCYSPVTAEHPLYRSDGRNLFTFPEGEQRLAMRQSTRPPADMVSIRLVHAELLWELELEPVDGLRIRHIASAGDPYHLQLRAAARSRRGNPFAADLELGVLRADPVAAMPSTRLLAIGASGTVETSMTLTLGNANRAAELTLGFSEGSLLRANGDGEVAALARPQMRVAELKLRFSSTVELARLQLSATTSTLIQSTVGEVLQSTITVLALGSDGMPFVPSVGLSLRAIGAEAGNDSLSFEPSETLAFNAAGRATAVLRLNPSLGLDSTLSISIDSTVALHPLVLRNSLQFQLLSAPQLQRIEFELPTQLVQSPRERTLSFVLQLRALSQRGDSLRPENLVLVASGDGVELQYERQLNFQFYDRYGYFAWMIISATPLVGRDSTLSFSVEYPATATATRTFRAVARTRLIAVPKLRELRLSLRSPQQSLRIESGAVTVAVDIQLEYSSGSGERLPLDLVLAAYPADPQAADPQVLIEPAQHRLAIGASARDTVSFRIDLNDAEGLAVELAVSGLPSGTMHTPLQFEVGFPVRVARVSLSAEPPGPVFVLRDEQPLEFDLTAELNYVGSRRHRETTVRLTVATVPPLGTAAFEFVPGAELLFADGQTRAAVTLRATLNYYGDVLLNIDAEAVPDGAAVEPVSVNILHRPRLQSLQLRVPNQPLIQPVSGANLLLQAGVGARGSDGRVFDPAAGSLQLRVVALSNVVPASSVLALNFSAGEVLGSFELGLVEQGIDGLVQLELLGQLPAGLRPEPVQLMLEAVEIFAGAELTVRAPRAQIADVGERVDFIVEVRAFGSKGSPFARDNLSLITAVVEGSAVLLEPARELLSIDRSGIAVLRRGLQLSPDSSGAVLEFLLAGEGVSSAPQRVRVVPSSIVRLAGFAVEVSPTRVIQRTAGELFAIRVRAYALGSDGLPWRNTLPELALRAEAPAALSSLVFEPSQLQFGAAGAAETTAYLTLAANSISTLVLSVDTANLVTEFATMLNSIPASLSLQGHETVEYLQIRTPSPLSQTRPGHPVHFELLVEARSGLGRSFNPENLLLVAAATADNIPLLFDAPLQFDRGQARVAVQVLPPATGGDRQLHFEIIGSALVASATVMLAVAPEIVAVDLRLLGPARRSVLFADEILPLRLRAQLEYGPGSAVRPELALTLVPRADSAAVIFTTAVTAITANGIAIVEAGLKLSGAQRTVVDFALAGLPPGIGFSTSAQLSVMLAAELLGFSLTLSPATQSVLQLPGLYHVITDTEDALPARSVHTPRPSLNILVRALKRGEAQLQLPPLALELSAGNRPDVAFLPHRPQLSFDAAGEAQVSVAVDFSKRLDLFIDFLLRGTADGVVYSTASATILYRPQPAWLGDIIVDPLQLQQSSADAEYFPAVGSSLLFSLRRNDNQLYSGPPLAELMTVSPTLPLWARLNEIESGAQLAPTLLNLGTVAATYAVNGGIHRLVIDYAMLRAVLNPQLNTRLPPGLNYNLEIGPTVVRASQLRLAVLPFVFELTAADLLWSVAIDSPAGRILTVAETTSTTELELDILSLDRAGEVFAVSGGLRLLISVESGRVQSLPASLMVGSGRVRVPLTLGAGNEAIVHFEIERESVDGITAQPQNVSLTPLRVQLSARPLAALVNFEPEQLELIQTSPLQPVVSRSSVQVLDSRGRTLQQLLLLGVVLRAASGVLTELQPSPLPIRGLGGVQYSILPLPGEDAVVTLTLESLATAGDSGGIAVEIREQQLRVIAAEVIAEVEIEAPSELKLRPGSGNFLPLRVRARSNRGNSLRPQGMVLRAAAAATMTDSGAVSTALLSFSGRDREGFFAALRLPVENPPAGIDSTLRLSIDYLPFPGYSVATSTLTRIRAVPRVERVTLAIEGDSQREVFSSAEITTIALLVELDFSAGTGFRPELELMVEMRLLAPGVVEVPPGLLAAPVMLRSDSEGRGRAAFAVRLDSLTAATLAFGVSVIGASLETVGTSATLTLLQGFQSAALQLRGEVPVVTSLNQTIRFGIEALLDSFLTEGSRSLSLEVDSDSPVQALQIEAPAVVNTGVGGRIQTTVSVTVRAAGEHSLTLRLSHPETGAVLASLTVVIPYRPFLAALRVDFSSVLVQSAVGAPFNLQLLGNALGSDGLPYSDRQQTLSLRITTTRNSLATPIRQPLSVMDGQLRLAGEGIMLQLLEQGSDGSFSFELEGLPSALAPLSGTVALQAVEIPQRLELRVIGSASRRIPRQFSNIEILVRGIGSRGNPIAVTGLRVDVQSAIPGSISFLDPGPFALGSDGIAITVLQLKINRSYRQAEVTIHIANDEDIAGAVTLELSTDSELTLLQVSGLDSISQLQPGTAVEVTLTVTALDSGRQLLPAVSGELMITAAVAEGVIVEFVGGSTLSFVAGVATVTAVVRPLPGLDAEVNFGIVGSASVEVEEHLLRVIAREILSRFDISAPEEIVQAGFQSDEVFTVSVSARGSKGNAFAPTGLGLVVSASPAGTSVDYLPVLNFAPESGEAQLQLTVRPDGVDVRLDYSITGAASQVSINSTPTRVIGFEGLREIQVMPIGSTQRRVIIGVAEVLRFSILSAGTKGSAFQMTDSIELLLQLILGDDSVHEQLIGPLVVDHNGRAEFAYSLLLPAGSDRAAVELTARLRMPADGQNPVLGRGRFDITGEVKPAVVEVELGSNVLIQSSPGAAIVTTVTVRVTGTDNRPYTPASELFMLSLSTARLSFSVDPPGLRFVGGVATANLSITPTPGEDSEGTVSISIHQNLEPAPRVVASSYTLTAVETLRLLSVEGPSMLLQTAFEQVLQTTLRVRAVGSKGTLLTPQSLMLNFALSPGVPAPVLHDALLVFDRADDRGAFAEVAVRMLPVAGEDTTISFGVLVDGSHAANHRVEPHIVRILAAPQVLSARLALLEGTALVVNSRTEVRISTLSLTLNYSGGSGGRFSYEVVLTAGLADVASRATLLPPLQRLIIPATGRIETAITVSLNGAEDSGAIFSLQGLPHNAHSVQLEVPLRYEPALGRLVFAPVAPAVQTERGRPAMFDIVVSAYDREGAPYDPVGLRLVAGESDNARLPLSFDGSLNFSSGSAQRRGLQVELIRQESDGQLQMMFEGIPANLPESPSVQVPVLATPFLAAVEVMAVGGDRQGVLSDNQRKLIELAVSLRYGTSRSYRQTAVILTAGIDDNPVAEVEFVGGNIATFSAGARNATLTVAVTLNSFASATIVLRPAAAVADDAPVRLPAVTVVLTPQLATLTATVVPEVVRQPAVGAAFNFAVELSAIGSDGRIFNPSGLELRLIPQVNSTLSNSVIPLNFNAGSARVMIEAELLRQADDGELLLTLDGLDAGFDFAPQTVVLEAQEFLRRVDITVVDGGLLRSVTATEAETLVLGIRTVGNRGGAVASNDLQLLGRVIIGGSAVLLMPDRVSLSIGEEGYTTVAVTVTLLAGGTLGRVNWSVLDSEGQALGELQVGLTIVPLLSQLRVEYSTDTLTLVQRQPGQELSVRLNIAAIDTGGNPYTSRLDNIRLVAAADNPVEVRFEPPSPPVVNGLATAIAYIRPTRGLDTTVTVMALLAGDESLTFIADTIAVTAAEILASLTVVSSSRLTVTGEHAVISVEVRALGSKNSSWRPDGIGIRFSSEKDEFNRDFSTLALDFSERDINGYFARFSTAIHFVSEGEDIDFVISALPSAELYPNGIGSIEVSTETLVISPQLDAIELSLLQSLPLQIPDLSGTTTATLHIELIYSGGSGPRQSIPLNLAAAFADGVSAAGAMINPQTVQLSVGAEAVATIDFGLHLGRAMSAVAVFSAVDVANDVLSAPLNVSLQRLPQLTTLGIEVLSPIPQRVADAPLVFNLRVRSLDRFEQPFAPREALFLNLIAADNIVASVTSFSLQFVDGVAVVENIEVRLLNRGLGGSVGLSLNGQNPAVTIRGQQAVEFLSVPVIERVEIRNERLSYKVSRPGQQLNLEFGVQLFYVDPQNVFDSAIELILTVASDREPTRFEFGSGRVLRFAGGALVSTLSFGITLNSDELTVVELEIVDNANYGFGSASYRFSVTVEAPLSTVTLQVSAAPQQVSGRRLTVEVSAAAFDIDGHPYNALESAMLLIGASTAGNTVITGAAELPLDFNRNRASLTFEVELLEQGIDGEILLQIGSLPTDVSSPAVRLALIAAEILSTVSLSFAGDVPESARIGIAETVIVEVAALGSKGSPFATDALTLNAAAISGVATIAPRASMLSIGNNGSTQATFEVLIAPGISSATVEFLLDGAGAAEFNTLSLVLQQDVILYRLLLTLQFANEFEQQTAEVLQATVTVTALGSDGALFRGAIELSTELVLITGDGARISLSPSGTTAALSFSDGVARQSLMIAPDSGRDTTAVLTVAVGEGGSGVIVEPLLLTIDARPVLAALVIETGGDRLLQDTVGGAVSTEVRIFALDSQGNRLEDVPAGLRLSAVAAEVALPVSGNEQELVFTAGVATVTLSIVPAVGMITTLSLSIDGLAEDSEVTVSSRTLRVEALELVELRVELPPRLQQAALGEGIDFVLAVSARGARGNLQLPTGLRVSNQTSSVTVSFGNGSGELIFAERDGVGYSTLSITALPPRGEDSTLVLSFAGGDGRVISPEPSVHLEAVAVVTEIRLRAVADSIVVFSSTDIAELPLQLEFEFSAGSAGREPVVVELEARAVPGTDSRVILTRARSRVELMDGSSTETRFAAMLGGASRADILVTVVSDHPDLAVVRPLRLPVVLQPVLARLEITAPMALNEQVQGGDIVFAATVMAFDRDDQPFDPTVLSLNVVAVDSNTAEVDSENFALSFSGGSVEVRNIRSRLLIPGDSGAVNLTVVGIDDSVEVEMETVELLAIPLLLGVSLSADGGPWSVISDSEELALTVRAALDYIGSSRYRMTTLRLTASSDSTATGLVFPDGAVLEFEDFALEATTTLLITLNDNRATTITLTAVGVADDAEVRPFELQVGFRPQLQTLSILPVAAVQQPSPGSSLSFDVSLMATGSDGRPFRPLATFLEVSGENNATPVDGRFALDFDSAGRARVSGIEASLQDQGQDGQLRLSVSGVPAGIEVAELLVDLVALQILTRLTLSVRDGLSEREVPSGEAQTLIIDLEGRGSKGMPFSHDSPAGEVVITVLSGELEIPVRTVPFQLTNDRTEAQFRVTLTAGDRAVVNIGLSGIDTTNLELLPSGGLELVLRRQDRLSLIDLTASVADYTQQILGLPVQLTIAIQAFDEVMQPLALANLMLQLSANNGASARLIPAIVDVPAEGVVVELLVLPNTAADTTVTVSLINIDPSLYTPLAIKVRGPVGGAASGEQLRPLIIDTGNSSGRPGLEELIYAVRWQAGSRSSEVEEEDVANLRLSTSSITAEGVDNLNRLFIEDEVPGGAAGSADTNRDNRADEIDARILLRYRAGLRCAALGDNINEALVRGLLGLDPLKISDCP